MSVHSAVQNNVVALHAASDGYRSNVIKVCNYVSAVANSSLPSLHHQIDQWDEFSREFVAAKTSALQWTNQVLEHLLATPGDVASFNQAFHAAVSDAMDQAGFLVNHPADPVAKALLTTRLNQLKGIVSSNKSEIEATLSKLNDFSKDLPNQAAALSSLADQARHGAEVDQKHVDDLRADIKRLNDEIDSLTAAIVALGVADAALVTLGAVAVAVAGPLGLVTWPFLGVGIAVASTYIALDAKQIAADKDAIKSDQAQINEYTQDAAVLTVFADSFDQLASQAEAIQANMRAIIAAWTAIETGVEQTLADVDLAATDASAQKWADVERDLQGASATWGAMITAIGALNIKVNANNAEIQLGMSADEVKTATTNATTMSFLEYINAA